MSGEIEIHHHHYGDGNEPADDGMSMADHAAGLADSVEELIRENDELRAIAQEANEDSIRLAAKNEARAERIKELKGKHAKLRGKHDALIADHNRALKDAVGHSERAARFEQLLKDYQIPY